MPYYLDDSIVIYEIEQVFSFCREKILRKKRNI